MIYSKLIFKQIIIGLLAFYPVLLLAQNDSISNFANYKLKGYYRNANRVGNFELAYKMLAEISRRDSGNIKISYKLAMLCFNNNRFTESIPYFMRAINSKNKKYLTAKYYCAIALKNIGKCDSALIFLQEFGKENNKIKGKVITKAKIKSEIESCSLQLRIKNSDVNNFQLIENAMHVENPILIDSTHFIAKHTNFTGDTLEKKQRWTLFNVSSIQNETMTDSVLEVYNKFNVNNGCFSLNKKRFYFTDCSENWKYNKCCQLYMAEKTNGKWGNKIAIEPMGKNNFLSTHLTVGTCYNEELEIIYFASNRPGGYGGTDIWYTVYNLKTKLFTPAYNAGYLINTDKDELTPFYDNMNHALYFSSNGYPSIGCFDIYKCYGDLVNWSTPENCGWGINSPADDFFYSRINSKSSLLASTRLQSTTGDYCCYNIFHSVNEISTNTNCKIKLKPEITIDSNNFQKIDTNKTIFGVNIFLMNDSNEPIFIRHDSIDLQNDIIFNLDTLKNYKIQLENSPFIENEFVLKSGIFSMKDSLQQIKLHLLPKDTLLLENIYYTFNSYQLNDSSKLYLDTTIISFLLKFQNFSIDVISHTDCIGTADYNLILSKKRAQTIAQYMIEKGIQTERIATFGMGATKPVESNFNKDGTDNPEGRKRNRRTEILLHKLPPAYYSKKDEID